MKPRYSHSCDRSCVKMAYRYASRKDIPYKNKPGNRMIKQWTRLSQNIANCQWRADQLLIVRVCIVSSTFGEWEGTPLFGLKGKVIILNVTVTVPTSSFWKLPIGKISDNIKQHRVNAVIFYERTLGTRLSRTNNNLMMIITFTFIAPFPLLSNSALQQTIKMHSF